MNDLLKELAEYCESFGSWDNKTYSFDKEKFAKLIVAECINKVRSRQMFSIQDEHNIHHAFDLLVYDLESHFGVEE